MSGNVANVRGRTAPILSPPVKVPANIQDYCVPRGLEEMDPQRALKLLREFAEDYLESMLYQVEKCWNGTWSPEIAKECVERDIARISQGFDAYIFQKEPPARLKLKHREKPKDRHGYIYVMQADGRYKIGQSMNPEQRRATIQTGHGAPIDIVYTRQVGTRFFLSIIEKELHSAFAHKRLAGEWFALVEGDVPRIDDLISGLLEKWTA